MKRKTKMIHYDIEIEFNNHYFYFVEYVERSLSVYYKQNNFYIFEEYRKYPKLSEWIRKPLRKERKMLKFNDLNECISYIKKL